ncbi:MAG TPA: NAD(P)-dependent oxidoreductase [Acetobacteraceae bacterium]|nr:NAD(P)-dependent oxidoreductase [Acetobacteraceae bacterium]
MESTFRVGLTRDLLTGSGAPAFGDAALGALGAFAREWVAEDVSEITPEIAARYDALCVNMPRVTAASVGRQDCRLRIVARHGVGYDSVDVPALTQAGIVLTNTPVAVRRPVATIAITYVLALAQKLLVKDRLTRSGGWNRRTDHMGRGLTKKCLGIVGAGSIGRETIRLARAFDMRILAADPYVEAAAVEALGAEKVLLELLMAEADFVLITCILNEETRHLIGAKEIALMKPTAYLINVARGPIVDEAALIAALSAGRIAGAGLDVFEREPVDPANPLLAMENTLVTPHALCWTDECFDAIATSALSDIEAALSGRRPRFVVNPEVLSHPRVRAWLNEPSLRVG